MAERLQRLITRIDIEQRGGSSENLLVLTSGTPNQIRSSLENQITESVGKFEKRELHETISLLNSMWRSGDESYKRVYMHLDGNRRGLNRHVLPLMMSLSLFPEESRPELIILMDPKVKEAKLEEIQNQISSFQPGNNQVKVSLTELI